MSESDLVQNFEKKVKCFGGTEGMWVSIVWKLKGLSMVVEWFRVMMAMGGEKGEQA